MQGSRPVSGRAGDPGYNESDIPKLLEGPKMRASRAFMSLLHLDSDSIEDYFILKLKERAPTHADKIITR